MSINNRWRKQPPNPVGVDETNRLTNGLIKLIQPFYGIDHVGGRMLSSTGTSASRYFGAGKGYRWTSTADVTCLTESVVIGTPLSILVVASQDTLGDYSPLFYNLLPSDGGGGLCLRIGATNTLEVVRPGIASWGMMD